MTINKKLEKALFLCNRDYWGKLGNELHKSEHEVSKKGEIL